MAISRDQPMRPALSDVLDAVDEQAGEMTGLSALLPSTDFTGENTVAATIAGEVTARENADAALAALLPSSAFDAEHTVSAALMAEATAREALAALLPATDYADDATVSDAIADVSSWYRKGHESVTVAASSSETVSVTYDEAFEADTICMTTHALDVISAADTDVTVTLDASDETGLEFTVANASADDPKTVTIGYFTIGV